MLVDLFISAQFEGLNVGHIPPAGPASVATLLLCGLIYLLGLTGFGQLILPFQADGSRQLGPDGTVVGSRRISQSWEGPEWSYGRSSATTAADPNHLSKSVLAAHNAASSTDRLAPDRKQLEASQPELANQPTC